MSKIQVNEIVNHFDTGAPDCPKGLTVTGVTTSANLSATNASVTGVSTLGNVVVGGATTDLVVTGDARVTGILTVGTASVTLNGNDGVVSGINTINGVTMPGAGGLTNRNIIINGGMKVAQRNTEVTSINSVSTIYATVDRMYHAINSWGTWTSTQESDGPDGFSKSWKMNCTTANSSLSAGDYALLVYLVEAQDLQHLNYGTLSAEDTIISFWVKSNKTGGASFEIIQSDNSNKQFCASYTINAADTWEYKTITIPADVTGNINDDNGRGMQISWWLGSGSNYTGGTHATTWESQTAVNRNASNLDCGMTIGDYFQITGIQWELGTQATPFEHRSYGDELLRCQRYYFRTSGYTKYGAMYGTSHSFVTLPLPVTMRADPSTASATLGGGGTVSTNYSNKYYYQQYITNDTTVNGSNIIMDAEIY